MPRPPRADVAGHLYHPLNRGNERDAVFHKDGDYEAFERDLNEGLLKFPVDLVTYCWMPNHWCSITHWGQLFGDAGRVETTARQYYLESTLRKPGRPCKFTHTAN